MSFADFFLQYFLQDLSVKNKFMKFKKVQMRDFMLLLAVVIILFLEIWIIYHSK
jgi:hypothetical protein